VPQLVCDEIRTVYRRGRDTSVHISNIFEKVTANVVRIQRVKIKNKTDCSGYLSAKSKLQASPVPRASRASKFLMEGEGWFELVRSHSSSLESGNGTIWHSTHDLLAYTRVPVTKPFCIEVRVENRLCYLYCMQFETLLRDDPMTSLEFHKVS